MTSQNTAGNGGFMSVELTGTSSTTGGAVCSLANPEGATLMIVRSLFLVKTASTGGANINIGVGATATTDASDIISALAINGVTANTLYNGEAMTTAAKTAYTVPALWTSDKFVNATGSATTAGFTGTLFLEYVRVAG